MKKSLSKQKMMFSKIPNSKSNKMHLEFSIKGMAKGRAFSKNKNDSVNKETVDGSCLESQTFAFNQDSLNNSKGTINKNYSLCRPDNKLIVFSSSLKNEFDKNKNQNFSKNYKVKASAEFYTENNISSCEDDNNNIFFRKNNDKINEDEDDEEDTNRIDYRYYPKIPEIESNKENNYFWLATYDKLMKKSKIIKILNYYTESSSKKINEIYIKDENSNNDDIKEKSKKYNFKEKSMVIEGYEIYFLQKFNKPFIRPKKGGKIFIKLYLLNLDQINKIFSYINRLEYKAYINNLDLFAEKNYYKIINKSNKTIYNYSTIFCLGSFVNINIYLFSHFEKPNNNDKTNFNINDLPSSNKLAKLIKILLINFPDFSKEYFIDYLMKSTQNDFDLDNKNKEKDKDKELFDQKLKEINSLLITNNKKSLKISKRNKYSANSVIKNVIQKIPTLTKSSHNTPDEFSNFSENISNNNNNNYNNNNVSFLNNFDKNTFNNRYHIDINNSDFLNNIKSEINIKPQKSEKNFKKIDMSRLIRKKLDSINLARSNQNTYIDNNITKRLDNRDILCKKINSISNSIKHISLGHPIQKSLTRYNTNKTCIQLNNGKLNNKIKNKSNNFNNTMINKENNINVLNTNYIPKDKFDGNINNNNKYLKTDVRLTHKSTRNKNNLNPFNLTNTNNIDKNNQKTRNKKYKKPIRVLSSIRKVISQKMNNMTGNTSSINLNNMNMSNSNNSIIIKKNDLLYNESNKVINYNKLVCKTNNNSKNKKSEYITPRKKKLYYYYH